MRSFRFPEEAPKAAAKAPATPVAVERIARDPAPAVAPPETLAFPNVEHARLSNGIELVYAQRRTVPMTLVSLSVDAGSAADPVQKRGISALTSALLGEGMTRLSGTQIAEKKEELGAAIGSGAGRDRSGVSLSALSTNLAPSLDLFADIILHPAFAAADVERVRGQMLASIAADKTSAGAMAADKLAPALYGAEHPYGAGSGKGTTDSVKGLREGRSEGDGGWGRKEELAVARRCPCAREKHSSVARRAPATERIRRDKKDRGGGGRPAEPLRHARKGRLAERVAGAPDCACARRKGRLPAPGPAIGRWREKWRSPGSAPATRQEGEREIAGAPRGACARRREKGKGEGGAPQYAPAPEEHVCPAPRNAPAPERKVEYARCSPPLSGTFSAARRIAPHLRLKGRRRPAWRRAKEGVVVMLMRRIRYKANLPPMGKPMGAVPGRRAGEQRSVPSACGAPAGAEKAMSG